MVSCACRRSAPQVLISSLGLCSLVLAGCDSELYHDLSERRANEALLVLKQAGLRADKRLEQRGTASRPSSFALTVPRSDEARALSLLGQRGLPRLAERAPSSGSKLLFSPTEQRAESAEQLAASLSETLERLPEVAEARVHLALPAPEPLSPLGTPRPTASVLLKLRAALSIQPGEVAELIAHAVPGLEVQDVAVVRAPAVPTEIAASPSASPLVAVGPMVVAAESRTLVIVLYGLLVALAALCVALARLAWPRRQPPARPLSSGANALR